MTAPLLEQADSAVAPYVCDVVGCARPACVALRFARQPGHVHVCGPCAAIDREHCDVVASWALPPNPGTRCTARCAPGTPVLHTSRPTELTW